MYSQKQLAQIAQEHKLYVPNWNIQQHYCEIIEHNEKSNYSINVFFHNNNPVAALTLHKRENFINVFVSPHYRGKSFGKKIIEKSLLEHNLKFDQVHAFIGEEGSEEFYRKAGIACFPNEIPLSSEEKNDFLNFNITYSELIHKKIKEKLEEYNSIPNLKLKP